MVGVIIGVVACLFFCKKKPHTPISPTRDSIHVELNRLDSVYEENVIHIINQSVDSDIIFFNDYLRRFGKDLGSTTETN